MRRSRLKIGGLRVPSPQQHARIPGVKASGSGTATVEIDRDLLARLRKRRPEQSDRELVERVARIELGFEAMHRAQQRTATAGTDQAEIEAEAVRAVKESRQEQAA